MTNHCEEIIFAPVGAPWTVTTIMGGFPTLGKEDSSTPAPQSYQNQNYQNREAMIATQ